MIISTVYSKKPQGIGDAVPFGNPLQFSALPVFLSDIGSIPFVPDWGIHKLFQYIYSFKGVSIT